MMTDYGVRVIYPFEGKRPGEVIFPTELRRDQLLRAGLAERVVPSRIRKPARRGRSLDKK